MTYEHILVPLDGSRLSEYILPQVKTLAAAFQSRVTLLHVIGDKGTDPSQLTQSQKNARADITKYLKGCIESLAKDGTQAEWSVSFGDPPREIVRFASIQDIDLIAMSTRGQGARSKDGTGSVAAAVVSAGSVPVLVVKPPDNIAKK